MKKRKNRQVSYYFRFVANSWIRIIKMKMVVYLIIKMLCAQINFPMFAYILCLSRVLHGYGHGYGCPLTHIKSMLIWIGIRVKNFKWIWCLVNGQCAMSMDKTLHTYERRWTSKILSMQDSSCFGFIIYNYL